MKDSFKFIFPGNPKYVPAIRMAVGSACENFGFDMEEIEDIKAALSEGWKSVSCHGMDGFAEECTALVDFDEGRVEIFISDTGTAHCVEKEKKPCIDCPREGDIGFFFIKTLMDQVEIVREEGKNSIKMLKERKNR